MYKGTQEVACKVQSIRVHPVFPDEYNWYYYESKKGGLGYKKPILLEGVETLEEAQNVAQVMYCGDE